MTYRKPNRSRGEARQTERRAVAGIRLPGNAALASPRIFQLGGNAALASPRIFQLGGSRRSVDTSKKVETEVETEEEEEEEEEEVVLQEEESKAATLPGHAPSR